MPLEVYILQEGKLYRDYLQLCHLRAICQNSH